MTVLRRHMLAWLTNSPEADSEPDHQHHVDAWHAAGRPFVIATPRHPEADTVSLGFCLPRLDADTPPRRVAAHAPLDQVTRTDRPPPVADVAQRCGTIGIGPAGALVFVADSAAAAGLDVRVFGSWMWWWLTAKGGGAYVTDRSDLDVLVTVRDSSEANKAVDLLARCQHDLSMRIDGELALPGGEVHWRELASEAPEVIRKSMTGPTLVPRKDLWA